MKTIRIIPRLDIKGPNLVKGIHLEGLRVLGKPWDFAYKYYKDGADELIYIDAVASLYQRNNLLDIVKRTAENIFIPLTVGGGIRSVDDVRKLLRAGADKVAINTAAIHDPQILRDCSNTFGSQCIVGSIQAKLIDGSYEVFTDNGREATGIKVYDWVLKIVDLGVGEILLTSIDRDGTGLGYDIELVSKVVSLVPVPVIACGGAGRAAHFKEVIDKGSVDSVSAASIFHYNFFEEITDMAEYEGEGNIEFLKQTRGSLDFMKERMVPTSIKKVKSFISDPNISCRSAEAKYL